VQGAAPVRKSPVEDLPRAHPDEIILVVLAIEVDLTVVNVLAKSATASADRDVRLPLAQELPRRVAV
jgi:hypothetical protein